MRIDPTGGAEAGRSARANPGLQFQALVAAQAAFQHADPDVRREVASLLVSGMTLSGSAHWKLLIVRWFLRERGVQWAHQLIRTE